MLTGTLQSCLGNRDCDARYSSSLQEPSGKGEMLSVDMEEWSGEWGGLSWEMPLLENILTQGPGAPSLLARKQKLAHEALC